MNPTPDKKPVKAPPQPEPAKPAKVKGIDSQRLRLLLLAVLGLSVLLFFGVFALGSAALSKESKKMVGLKVQSQTADAQLANLEQAKKQVDKYSFFKDVATTVIPSDKDQAAAVVEINKMADESGIAIQSITFPASTLGLTTTTTTSTTAAAQDATSSSASAKAISQAKPVSGSPGLYSLELTITPQSDANTPAGKQITYAKMVDFLRRIENNRHTAQITNVNISPAGTANNISKGLTFTLITNIFIKP